MLSNSAARLPVLTAAIKAKINAFLKAYADYKIEADSYRRITITLND